MMINVLAPAKINLTLNITGRRDDGYHYVDMVMQAISLYDEISVKVVEGKYGINISCDNAIIPTDNNNTAYKAAKYYLEKIGKNDVFVDINLIKKIPSQAGLAGGSTDAAGVILALNEYYNNILSPKEMLNICSKVGADVPFCLYGGTSLSTGIGTTLKKLRTMPECYIVLAKPYINVSTKKAYELSDKKGYSKQVASSEIINCINNDDIYLLSKNLYNDFEEVLKLDEVTKIKNIMIKCSAIGASMSGSGPTVYSIFTNELEAKKCVNELKKEYEEVYIAKPISNGCTVV